jgi:iron-sulfur cluster assembly accessory protein
MTASQTPAATVNVSLTEIAVEQVKVFMDQEDVAPETSGLRVSVMPGGCSGFQYGLNIEEKPLDDDYILEQDGVRIFVDAFSAQYLDGISVDFQETMQGSGFAFNNPNATGGCGCGSSFTA